MAVLKRGNQGDKVKMLQEVLADLGYEVGEIDGIYGEQTELAVISFQGDHGLDMDGRVGPETMGVIESAMEDEDEGEEEIVDDEDDDDYDYADDGEVFEVLGGRIWKVGARGEEVEFLQEVLEDLGYDVGELDGEFGEQTEAAVIAFQGDHELDMDGVVGKKTIEALQEALSEEEDDGFEDDDV